MFSRASDVSLRKGFSKSNVFINNVVWFEVWYLLSFRKLTVFTPWTFPVQMFQFQVQKEPTQMTCMESRNSTMMKVGATPVEVAAVPLLLFCFVDDVVYSAVWPRF